MKDTTDKDRLIAGMKAVLDQPINDAEARTRPIEELESIAWASYRADIEMRRLVAGPLIGQQGTGGPNGRWLTEQELRAIYAAHAAEHERKTARHLADLRALTGDDDAAWAKRLDRIEVKVEGGRHEVVQ
ncbi:MAG: hypothetical protein KIT63_13385 [Rhodoferax sp.]|nr:hypothetical protein [Rhodoferax sp.]